MATRLHALIEVGRVLARSSDYPSLFRKIIDAACDCLEAEGGTFYLHDEKNNCLRAVVAVNELLGIDHVLKEFDPSNIVGLFSVPLGDGESKEKTVSGACYQIKAPVVITDLDKESEYDLSNVKKFDKEHGYETKSILAVPMFTKEGSVIGVLQLLNAKQGLADVEDVELVEAMASIMGIAIENNLLLLGTQNLLDEVVGMISSAIDERSKVTGGHCQRVTILTMMLAQAMTDDDSGPYKDLYFSEEDLHELQIAAQLHDVGKIATPDYVLQKSKKLENVRDNIDYLKMRFHVRDLEVRNQQLMQALEQSGATTPEQGDSPHEEMADFGFVESLNIGAEFLDDKAKEKLREIASRQCLDGELIEGDDLTNLLIERGTLNHDERKIMENHASISIRLLNKLPWPAHFTDVPEIAGKHHENCDGSGYPNGIKGEQMSLRAKILSLTDRFEGLSAPDRDYRKPKSLEQVLAIMERMASANQVDPELYRFFIDSGVCENYARSYLNAQQLADEVKAKQTAA